MFTIICGCMRINIKREKNEIRKKSENTQSICWQSCYFYTAMHLDPVSD